MIYIDKCAYTNKLAILHPLVKMVLAIMTMFICISSDFLLTPLIITLVMTIITVGLAKIPLKFYLKLMLVPLSFIILGVITVLINVLDTSQNALWSVDIFGIIIGITPQNLMAALLIFLKSLGTVSCLYFLSLTTSIVDIVSVLRKCRIPEIYLELMTLIYRVIFILIGIVGKIYTSQDSRLGYSTVKNRFRSITQLISCLFSLSYKKTSDLFNSLEARCYNGKLNVLEKQYQFKSIHLLYVLIIDMFLVIFDVYSNLIFGKFLNV